MKIYFCEKCGISIPLQEVVGGRATARDGKTYCQGCLPRERAESDDLKLYFCDSCKVSIPLQDVITNAARPEGESMLCAECARLSPAERVTRREQMQRESEEKEESRYRLHFCDGCNTSIPQSHIVTGRAVVRGGRTYCERCKVRVERPRASFARALTYATILVGLLVVAFFIVGGPSMVSGGRAAGGGPAREEEIRKDVLAAVAKGLEEKQRDTESRISQLLGRVEDLAKREESLSRSLDALRTTAEESVRRQAEIRSEVENRLQGGEAAFRAALDRLDALAARLESAKAPPPAEGRAPEAPPPPALPIPAPAAPTPAKPAPPPVEEAPAEVKELLRQLESEDEGTRFGAAVQLGKSGWAGAAEPLGKVLQKDRDTFVRRAAARALGELKAWSAVPVLIETLEDKEFFVAVTAHKALIEVTGQDFGYQENLSRTQLRKVVQKAREWWDAHQNDR